MPFLANIPLSLYIHIPWCVRKCPYCDFNSHAVKNGLQEEIYVAALLQDCDENIHRIDTDRPLTSIFFGGGTPSLFSAQAIGAILEGVNKRFKLANNIEITLEANPGTTDEQRFKEYHALGINRLSIGVQSLQNSQLKTLGRIHDREAAIRAVKTAQDGGFDNINVDIMYGLPQQTRAESLQDLRDALKLKTSHFSWYQLTIEPNTEFHHTRPTLPIDDDIADMQAEGQEYLASQSFKQYEVSAYSLLQRECRHNLNYWQFGDYLGIGAGAHSKITDAKQQIITRHSQVKNPRDYLDPLKPKTAQNITVSNDDIVFEFMLNALRLTEGVPLRLFVERTGLGLDVIETALKMARARGLLNEDDTWLRPTELGKRFLNDLVGGFLPGEE